MATVPSQSAFSPLPELIAQFGLPNPLAYLDQSQNTLESAYGASADWRAMAGQLRGVSTELRSAVAGVQWSGPGGDRMRQEVDSDVEDLERRIEELENSAEANDDGANQVIKIISTILIILGVLVGILAATFAIAIAAGPWTFGVSLTLWVAQATGLSLGALTAITTGVAAVLMVLSQILTLVDMWLV